MSEVDFYGLLRKLEITHHRSDVIRRYLNDVLFSSVSFAGKGVLDVGGGRGLCSFFAAFQGAASVHNVEPMAAGSEQKSQEAFGRARSALGGAAAQLVNRTIQEHLTDCCDYDVVILHDSVNHIDEATYSQLHRNGAARDAYVAFFECLARRHRRDGALVITDCARRNFFGDLGLRSPFAPSINWHLHQDPILLAGLLRSAGYTDIHWKWTPLKRAGAIGRLLARLGRIPSYFLQSHFVLFARRSD